MSENNGNTGSDSAVDTSSNENSGEIQEQQQGEGQTPAQVRKKINKLKFKVDGQEVEESLPFEIDDDPKTVDYMRRHLQMSKAAVKRMNESAQEKQKAAQLFKVLQENPRELFKHPALAKQLRAAFEEQYLDEIRSSQMTDEEKKVIRAEQILREREEERKRQIEEQETTQFEQLQNHYAQQLEKVIVGALTESGLPKVPKTIKIMANLLKQNANHGLELEPRDLAKLAKEQYLEEMREILSGYDEDGLLSVLGDDFANKIRRADLKRFRNPQNGQFVPAKKAQDYTPPKDQEPQTKEEWREMIRRRSQS